MRVYWDTSAVINAFLSADVLALLDQGEHFTRLHTFSEFFCTMTGRGIPAIDSNGNIVRTTLDADDCAAWLRMFRGKVQFVELDADELLGGLDEARKRNVQGGHVYDYVHALASNKAKADELRTRNTSDFVGLTEAKVVWP